MKSVQMLFKAAQAVVCFVNNRRDTAYYTLMAGYAMSELTHGDVANMAHVVNAVVARELVRAYSWRAAKKSARMAGDQNETDYAKFSMAAGVGVSASFFALMMPYMHYDTGTANVGLMMMPVAGLAMYHFKLAAQNAGIGIAEVPKLYKGMWDWPSRGNGPAQQHVIPSPRR